MKLEWAEQALEGFRNIRSQHYTQLRLQNIKNACSKIFKKKSLFLVQVFQ
ncbi:hypothetical protein GCM10009001_30330 [Virgibacillus siamensis]|uniref:Uncharacterized protein n=1 Tax=Virgibacillus siamensis TaxID=480071 RepID=A0ABN1GGL4_9BACI